MLREIIDLQNKAVEDLIEQVSTKREITFKAPTGSGKTYIMADFMNRILERNPNVIFIVSSLSTSNLAKQNYEKFKEYIVQGNFETINPFLISSESSSEEGLYIPTNYNVYVLPRDLYKETSKLNRGAIINFLNTITSKNFMEGLNKEIYLIKDECHQATTKLDNLSDYFSKIINISATPNLKRGQIPDVEIKENDAIQAKLIKTVVWGDESDTLTDALYKFKEIKEQYKTTGINPCMIIQISNAEMAEKELNEIIFPTLNNKDFSDLIWMYIVSDPNGKENTTNCKTNDRLGVAKLPISKWKDYAKKNNSSVDIIIFKMVIKEGWDIPRACMLYQERDTQSKILDEQVIGRVRRNPCLLNYERLDETTQNLISKAYVWGISASQSNISVKIKDGKKDALKIMTTRLKRNDEKNIFNIKELVNNQTEPISYGSIFDLYEKFNKLDSETKQSCFENIENYSDWFKYAFNSPKIQTEFKKSICNYQESMELTKDDTGNIKLVSFPVFSTYEENTHNLKVKNWVWCRYDNIDKFSFDSEAEKDFAEELKEFVSNESETKNDFIWGKNFLPNSEIRFEYYSDGIHSSYPDFILKDKYEKIHIFEVKSVNKSSSQNIDEEKYNEKIKLLEECYKQAAILTGYNFYLPIQNGSTWDIIKIEKNGEESLVTRNLSIDTVLDALK